MGEAALDDLAAFAHGLLADLRFQPVAVCIDGGARLIIAMPAQIAVGGRGLGDARLPWPAVEVFQSLARMITLVADQNAGLFRTRCKANRGEVVGRRLQRARQGRRVTLVS